MREPPGAEGGLRTNSQKSLQCRETAPLLQNTYQLYLQMREHSGTSTLTVVLGDPEQEGQLSLLGFLTLRECDKGVCLSL